MNGQHKIECDGCDGDRCVYVGSLCNPDRPSAAVERPSVGISRSEAEGNETEPSFERLMSDLTLSSGNLSRISTLSPEQRDRLRQAIMNLHAELWRLTPADDRYEGDELLEALVLAEKTLFQAAEDFSLEGYFNRARAISEVVGKVREAIRQAANLSDTQVGMEPEGRNENQNTFNNGDTWPPVGWKEIE